MEIKLFYTIYKIWICWRLGHKTLTEDDLIAWGHMHICQLSCIQVILLEVNSLSYITVRGRLSWLPAI
jgi:hypothetical protein